MLAGEKPIDRSPLMKAARTVAEVLAEHTSLTLERVDRMYLDVHVPLPQLQRGAGAAWFFREVRNWQAPSSVLMAPTTRRFVAAIKGYARSHRMEIVPFRFRFRRGERTREYLRRWHAVKRMLYVGEAQEKARTLRTRRPAHRSGDQRHLRL